MNTSFSKLSLKHQIALELKRLVFSGQLKPGQKITEVQIAKDLDVSRTSVREAILLLELEGVITSSPYRETRITAISQEEVIELLIPIRVEIETYALRRGFPSWDAKTKGRLANIVKLMRSAAKNDDLPEFIEQDIRFHELIVRSSKLENVIRIWESIVYRIRMHFLYQNSKSPNLEKWLSDHQFLAETLQNPETTTQQAVAVLKEHIVETNLPDVYFLDNLHDDIKE